jgi:asparagine synthetase B (glutamine-hydrolysing)
VFAWVYGKPSFVRRLHTRLASFAEESGRFDDRVGLQLCTFSHPSTARLDLSSREPGTIERVSLTLGEQRSNWPAGFEVCWRVNDNGQSSLALRNGFFGGRAIYVGDHTEGCVISNNLLVAEACTDEAMLPEALAAWIVFAGVGNRVLRGSTQRLPSSVRWHRTGLEPWVETKVRPTLAPEAAPSDLFTELRKTVEDATRDPARKPGRVAVLVSGGIDSSAVFAAACELGLDVVPIAYQFAGEGDDRPYLRALLRYFGKRAEVVRPRDARRWLRSSLHLLHAPYTLMSSAYDFAAYARARALGCTQVLTGLGGDEMLSGCLQVGVLGTSFPKMRHLPAALARARGFQYPWPTSAWQRMRALALRPFIRAHLPLELDIFRRRRRAFRTPWLRPEVHAHLAGIYEMLGMALPGTTNARCAAFAYRNAYDDYADARGQLDMAFATHTEDVFLRGSFAETVARWEPRDLIPDLTFRGGFRRSLRGHVPQEIAERTSKGSFDHAFLELFQDGERALLLDLAQGTHLANQDVVDRTSLSHHATIASRSRSPLEHNLAWTCLWPTLALEGTLRTRNEQAVPAEPRT